jgi:predicted membrane chloride channel (bestrophin family)
MKRITNPLILKVLPIVCAVMAVKFAAHLLGWEILTLNPLFSGIIAANVFLIGFLISGVLTDYKESEKLPGELAASIETIIDEATIIYKSKRADSAKECLDYMRDFTIAVKGWLFKTRRTQDMLGMVHGLNDYFLAFESVTQPNFIVRLKQEQNNIRRMLIRIHTIRETSFVASGYLIAEATAVLVVLGLVLTEFTPFYESMFFVGVVSFLLTFLLALIRNLDNPFGYSEGNSTENITLKPLEDLICELEKEAERTGSDGVDHIAARRD